MYEENLIRIFMKKIMPKMPPTLSRGKKNQIEQFSVYNTIILNNKKNSKFGLYSSNFL